jgi:hypothetical protein
LYNQETFQIIKPLTFFPLSGEVAITFDYLNEKQRTPDSVTMAQLSSALARILDELPPAPTVISTRFIQQSLDFHASSTVSNLQIRIQTDRTYLNILIDIPAVRVQTFKN